jgi:VanZ family protein
MRTKINKTKIFYILMTILTASLIFYASSIKTTAGEASGINLAAFYHFGIFFMLTFFLSLSLKNGSLDKKTLSIILLLSLAYSLSDELHQLFVPGRFSSLKDVAIDFSGSLLSVFVLKVLERFRKI